MIDLQDIEFIEGETTCTMEQYYLAIQKTINSGLWSMQGSYGRTMMDAISAGLCMLGQNQASDYYGNTIPSRDDVKPGTKGSYQFVVDERGEEWANLMAEVQ